MLNFQFCSVLRFHRHVLVLQLYYSDIPCIVRHAALILKEHYVDSTIVIDSVLV